MLKLEREFQWKTRFFLVVLDNYYSFHVTDTSMVNLKFYFFFLKFFVILLVSIHVYTIYKFLIEI